MNYFPRQILKKVNKYLSFPEILVIHGSRQVGKTTLMKILINEMNKKKMQCFYIDLEDFYFLDLCNTGPNELISYLKQKKLIDERLFLFIDEIQYLENPSSFLKIMADQYNNIVKVIVSGSSSFAIKSKFKDSLVGRIIDFELFGLNFSEFLQFKNYPVTFSLPMNGKINDELKLFYKEYALYGAYPRLVLENSIEYKETLIKQILNNYIRKDLVDLARIRDIQKYNHLLRILAGSITSLLNVNEIANTTALSRQTIGQYLFIMENTYVIKQVYPHFINIRTELTKMPKLFFEDTGIANILANNIYSEKLSGALFENSIFSELRKNPAVLQLHYWRTTDKQEVDFIIHTRKGIIPVEVKLSYSGQPVNSLLYFLQKYKIKKGYICTLKKTRKGPGNNMIDIVYPWELNLIIQ